MKKILTLLAVIAISFTGLTTVDTHPACDDLGEGPDTYIKFVQALLQRDLFAVQFYAQEKGCGLLIGDIRAEIVEEGDNWIKVKLYPEGDAPVEVYTSFTGVKE